jgi:arginase/N-omega-hydroxy-L-arginine amidinohydrolase
MNIHAFNPAISRADGVKAPERPAVLALSGWVCDRYSRAAMEGAPLLARAAARDLGVRLRELGRCEPPFEAHWQESLAKAKPYLREVAGAVEEVVRAGKRPFIFANRCGASLATIPAMLRARPEVKLVWFDAHADFNTPATTPTGYLGGMVVSALCGLWDSGFGDGLPPDRVILAGVRDLDAGEEKLALDHKVKIITARGAQIDPGELIAAIAGAPIIIHIDTDVIDPAYLPAEYRIANGIRPSALHRILRSLAAENEIVGFELTEFEAPQDPVLRARAVTRIIRMIGPALRAADMGR